MRSCVVKIAHMMFALETLAITSPALAQSSASSHFVPSSDEAFLIRHPWVCIGTSGFYHVEKTGSNLFDCVEQRLTFRPDRTVSITRTDGTTQGGLWRLDNSKEEQTILTITQNGSPDLTFIVFPYAQQDRLNLVEPFSGKTELKKVRSYGRLP